MRGPIWPMMTLMAATALGSMALAQTGSMPQPSVPPSAPSSKPPSNGSTGAPDAGAPDTLSHQLSRSHGVITPPATAASLSRPARTTGGP
jgi:hypothetical protein